MTKLPIKKRIGRLLEHPLHYLFNLLQVLGLHIVRNHYYQPVPDTRLLSDEYFSMHTDLNGIDMNDSAQLALLRDVFPNFVSECQFSDRPTKQPYDFHLGNEKFESLDAEVLYSFIRHYKPKRVIEIGSGYSTFISARAALINQKKDFIDTNVIAIEPFPNKTLLKGFPGLKELVIKKVEDIDIRFFPKLDAGDILFIDSSHVVKIGSEVLFEYLELLPRLKKGVIVHIHDIFLPAHYPKLWVINQHKFWTEQYLLQAFLCLNKDFEIIWASSYMSMKYREDLELVFPSWKGSYKRLSDRIKKNTCTQDGFNVWPVSFWIRRKL